MTGKPTGPVTHRRSVSTLGWIRRGAMSNLAFPVAALATSPILARALGADGRGALAAVTVPFMIVASVLTFGMPEALTYHVARRRVTARQTTAIAVVVPVVAGILSAVAAYFLVPGLLGRYPRYVTLGQVTLIGLPLTLVIQNLRGVALGAARYRLVFAERYLSVVFRLGPIVLLLLVGRLTVTTAVVVAIGAGLVSGLVLVTGRRGATASHAAPEALEPTRRVVRYGLLVWFGSIAQLLTFRLDQVVLATVVPAALLGAYAVAVSLAEVSNSLTSAVREVLFTRASDRNDTRVIAQGTRLAVALSAGIAVVGGLTCELLLVPIFGPGFEPAVRLTQILLVASIGSGVGAVVGVGLAAEGRPGGWSMAQLAGFLLTVVLIWPAVQTYGATGAALLSVVTYWGPSIAGVRALSVRSGLPLHHYLLPRPGDVRRVLALRR